MKTLKQFQEATGYLKVKSPDEQKFVDKHEVETMDDQNGNGDDVFKASKVKKVARKAERKGYEPGEDEEVYEEVEQIDELSTDTMKRYQDKARTSADALRDKGFRGNAPAWKKAQNRSDSIDRAQSKIKARSTNEEAEQIDELSQDKLMSYRKAARKQGTGIQDKMKVGGGDWSKDGRDTKTLKKRMAGYKMAGRKVNPGLSANAGQAPRVAATEEVQIDESAGGRYNDVHNSTKDLLKKINTHLTTHKTNAMKAKNYKGEKGPHWGHVEHMKDIHRTLSDIHDRLAQQGEYAMHEEVERVDEISKATMGRYINRAKDQIDTVSYRQGHRDSRGAGSDPISRKNERKLSKRHGGIELAVKKMTKEEADYLVNRYAEFKENISGLTPRLQEAMHYVLDRLNEENQDKFIAACQTEEGLEKMVAFAIENRGE